MKRSVNYTLGYEFDSNLNINRTARAIVEKAKTGFHWHELRPDHRYSTDFDKSYAGSCWKLRRCFDL